ncbi:GPALPP motifs-containing protein 1 [Mactra antiquata]
MSDSDDSYGPPLPPGLANKKDDTDSSDDQYGPPLPKKSKSSDNVTIGPTMPSIKGGNLDKYSSDSDSDSSSSDSSDSDYDRKKRKKKSHKSKKSDYNRRGSEVSKDSKHFIGPCIPSNSTKYEDNISHRSIGPALPPGSAQYSDNDHSRQTNVPGNVDDDDDYGIGPSINLQASEQDCSAVAEFEGRSQKMLKKLTSTPETEMELPKQRESWMTELPDQIGVSFGLSNRQFRAKDAPEQDHSWTKTPKEKDEEKSKDGKKKKKYEIIEKDKNEKASKEIEEYNKKHRPKSLLEMHQKKLEKKKKKEKKKNKDKKAERRPFDRDLDLKVNRLDEAQRKAFIKRSQDLGSRFKTGGTGTSFM